MRCDCIKGINEKIAEVESGVALDTPIHVEFSSQGSRMWTGMRVALCRTDGTRKRISTTVAATFCPFCGTKIKDEPRHGI